MRKKLVLALTGLALLTACEVEDETAPLVPELEAEFSHATGPGALVRVILELPSMNDQAILAQQARRQGVRVLHQYRHFRLLAVEVNENALSGLRRSPRVISVMESKPERFSLDSSVPVIHADDVHALGFDGSGYAVAILDTGIDAGHPFLGGRVVNEACFSTPSGVASRDETSLCASGTTGPGTASSTIADCMDGTTNLCFHGQHVAGIAAGDGTGEPAPAPAAGVAPGADIVAIQVFVRSDSDDEDACDGDAPCVYTYPDDQVAALDQVFDWRNTYDFAAVNMSLGGGEFDADCDTDNQGRKDAIDDLLAAGIATVIAAGNNGFQDAVSRPGCISTAVTVGATTDADGIAWFSNRGPLLDLFAPGVGIFSSEPAGAYGTHDGTSMSTPHVTGAFAVMRQADPTATVAEILQRLQDTGIDITDANGVTRSRIDLLAALEPGTIIIEKETTPAGRVGSSFTDNIAAPNTFTLNDGDFTSFLEVTPGTYSVTESDPGSYMTLYDISCEDPTTNSSGSGATATINLAPGETVTCTFTNLDQPPTLSPLTPSTQTVQYSDEIADITVAAMDSYQDVLTASFSHSVDGGLLTPGLPSGLVISAPACVAVGVTQTCTWTITGHAGVPAGTYTVTATVTDDDGDAVDEDATIVVLAEDASVSFDGSNPVGVQVSDPGGNSGLFSLTVYVEETEPDLAAVAHDFGDISQAVVSMSLIPIGPGGSETGVCVPGMVTGAGYDQVLPVTCSFDEVPVNTYGVAVTVAGGFYEGDGEDVLTVYDPSLGFTTGGGWFYWPGTTERTNFGYTMKYNKKGQRVQGSLLLIRHLPDGTKYRVKSNQLAGLSIGDGGGFAWASFTGKSTYLEPGWPEPIGNQGFVAYVEDRGDPGNEDRFWIEMRDRDGNLIVASSIAREAFDNARILEGGNIVVPHVANGGNDQ